jgi:hypothetical protein
MDSSDLEQGIMMRTCLVHSIDSLGRTDDDEKKGRTDNVQHNRTMVAAFDILDADDYEI